MTMPHVPVCLDVSRLVSRVGLGAPTGIDRVERAYLDWALSRGPEPTFLCRTTRGYLLLGREGGRHLQQICDDPGRLPRADLLSRLSGKAASTRHRAEAALRPHALARALPGRFDRMLSRGLPEGAVYFNVGHSNLSKRTLSCLAAMPQVRLVALVHDLIPVEHPDLVAAGQPDRFRAAMDRVARHCDLVICNSEQTRRAFAAAFAAHRAVTMPIGLSEAAEPDGKTVSELPNRAFFLALGTIEPRKNHAVLLDAWEILADRLRETELPELHIIGRRGWRNEDLFHRLETHPLIGRAIFEHGPLPDSAVRAYLGRARALLFPSLAEGFGYPPLEALRDGVLPICSDLPVLREMLGDSAVYLDPSDAYSWAETIEQLIADSFPLRDTGEFPFPTWNAHFDRVEAELGAIWKTGQKGTE